MEVGVGGVRYSCTLNHTHTGTDYPFHTHIHTERERGRGSERALGELKHIKRL